MIMKKRKYNQLTYSSKDLELPKPTLLERLLKSLPPPPLTKKEEARELRRYLEHDHFVDENEPTKG